MPENFKHKDNEIEKKLKTIGKMIDSQLPKHLGFTLLLFNYGPGGGMFYISKSERKDMIKAMEEMIDKLKNNKL